MISQFSHIIELYATSNRRETRGFRCKCPNSWSSIEQIRLEIPLPRVLKKSLRLSGKFVCVWKSAWKVSLPRRGRPWWRFPRSSFVSNRIRRGFQAGDPSISRGILTGDDTWLLHGTRPRLSVLAPYHHLPSRLPRPRWTQWGDRQSATGSRTACTPRKCAWISRDTRVSRGRDNSTSKSIGFDRAKGRGIDLEDAGYRFLC